MKKTATNKQILDAYGQSYKMMQEAKRHQDSKKKIKNERLNKKK